MGLVRKLRENLRVWRTLGEPGGYLEGHLGILTDSLGLRRALGGPECHWKVKEGNLGLFEVRMGSWGALTGLYGARGMMGVVGAGIIWFNRAVEHHGSSGHSCNVSR